MNQRLGRKYMFEKSGAFYSKVIKCTKTEIGYSWKYETFIRYFSIQLLLIEGYIYIKRERSNISEDFRNDISYRH